MSYTKTQKQHQILWDTIELDNKDLSINSLYNITSLTQSVSYVLVEVGSLINPDTINFITLKIKH